MTLAVDDDFARFVAARWSDLEPVAHLVTLDSVAARHVTTEALAGLHGSWDEVVDRGSPAATARRAVLTGSLEAARGARVVDLSAAVLAEREGEVPAAEDAVSAALVEVVLAAAPLERAVLAAATTWGLDAVEVAELLGRPSARVRDAEAALWHRLAEAHAATRQRLGWAPAEWALSRDVDAALERVLGVHEEPPDPAELVGRRRRQLRRRSLLLGGMTTAAVGAVGAVAFREVASGAASGAPVVPPGPGDPVWGSTATWPARGRLAADQVALAVVAASSPAVRLVYAEDLPGRRVVVAAATADNGGRSGTEVRMWAGPEGAGPDLLDRVSLGRDRVRFVDDVLPVLVPGPAAGGLPDLLLLGRPLVPSAEYSPRVSYRSTGEVVRAWTTVELSNGVARVPLWTPTAPALRVRLDGYEGGAVVPAPLGLASPEQWAPLADSLPAAVGPFVAACTGVAESALRHRVVLDIAVRGDVFVPTTAQPPTMDGRAVVLHTVLPSGAVLRSVRAVGTRHVDEGPVDLETARSLPVDQHDAPFAVRLPWVGSTRGRFLVLAPGAARAQLVAMASSVYRASEVTPLTDGSGVLDVADARTVSTYVLVLWDESGRRLGEWRQTFARGDPRDLWATFR